MGFITSISGIPHTDSRVKIASVAVRPGRYSTALVEKVRKT